jgi:hypothetical protein
MQDVKEGIQRSSDDGIDQTINGNMLDCNKGVKTIKKPCRVEFAVVFTAPKIN